MGLGDRTLHRTCAKYTLSVFVRAGCGLQKRRGIGHWSLVLGRWQSARPTTNDQRLITFYPLLLFYAPIRNQGIPANINPSAKANPIDERRYFMRSDGDFLAQMLDPCATHSAMNIIIGCSATKNRTCGSFIDVVMSFRASRVTGLTAYRMSPSRNCTSSAPMKIREARRSDAP